MAAKDARQRRYVGNKYALMGAVGTAMTAGSAWYDKEQVRKAQELKDQQLLALKQGELDLGYKKLETSERLADERNAIDKQRADVQAQQIEDIQSRYESTGKRASIGTFLTNDFETWKKNYVGDDADSKMRAKAWSAVLTNGLETYSDEQLQDISAKIAEQFGTGASGKPLLSLEDIKSGVEQLRTRAKMRGLTIDDVTNDDIRSLLSSSFTMEAEPDPTVDPAAVPALMGEETYPGSIYPMQGVSEALFGEQGADYLYEGRQNMFEPYFQAGESLMEQYQKNIGGPTQEGINWLGRKAFGIGDR